MAEHIWTGAVDTDFGTAGNWSPAGPPATGDTGIVPASATVNIAGSDETSAPLDKFIVEEGCTITIGSAATKLQLSFASETNCIADLSGTGLTYLSLAEAKSIIVRNAAVPPGTGQYGLNLIGLTATNNPTLNISIDPDLGVSGDAAPSVSIGANATEAMEVQYINVTGGVVTIGDGVTESDGATAPDMDISNGTVTCSSPLGAVTQSGGTLWQKAGAVTTLHQEGGTCYYMSTGTITNLRVNNGGVFDCTRDLSARTVTNCVLSEGGQINDPQKTVTFTNGIDLENHGPTSPWDRGKHYTVSFSAI